MMIAMEVVDSLKESLKKMRNNENEFKNIYEKLTNYVLIPIFQFQHQKKKMILSKLDA